MEKNNLTKSNIESINSLGQFYHGHWDFNGGSINHEEGMRGRADFLLRKVQEIIKNNFSNNEIKKASIIDIGCYDGWITHQLSHLPFKEIIGIEPRINNITKGKMIRKILNIKTRVKFKQDSLESLAKHKKQFDIVLCLGVLHHCESIFLALKQLDKISKKILVISTICLPSKFITENIKNYIELKDVVYFNQKKIYGLTGQKYESAYSDGSTFNNTVVSIPSLESLIMYLNVLDYDYKIIANHDDFSKSIPKDPRISQEILICAVKREENKKLNYMNNPIKDYEQGLIETNIQSNYILPIFDYICLKKRDVKMNLMVKKIIAYIDFPDDKKLKNIFNFFKNIYQQEIIKNLKYNPADKIGLEWGKILYSQKKYNEAIQVLQSITQRLNTDWRCVYRSFYLLKIIYEKIGDNKKAEYYHRLCKNCNPNFPLL